jgi:hypothetical protein
MQNRPCYRLLIATACSLALWNPVTIAEEALSPTQQNTLQRFQAMSAKLKEALHLQGKASQETAYRVNKPRELTKIRQNIWLTQSAELNEHASITSTQRISYDAVFDATGSFPETVASDQEFEAELRETYLDLSLAAIDLRLGKQQIVWGDAIGLFFADVVNAKDLREFVLQDFDRIRIPQWAVNAESSWGDGYTQFVWIPGLKFNRLGTSGSAFEFPLPVPNATTPATVVDPATPPSSVSNSEVGGRIGYLINGWDLSTFYLYSWNKFPVTFRSITGGTYAFRPEYRRQHYVGGSFSKEIEPVVLRGELLVSPGNYLPTLDVTDADGILRRTTVDYVLGVSHTWLDVWDTTFQLMQRYVPNHHDLIANEHELRTQLGLLVSREFLDGRVKPECLTIIGLQDSDLLWRPAISMHWQEALEFKLGADILQGEREGVFGRFDHQSRVYTELTYHF